MKNICRVTWMLHAKTRKMLFGRHSVLWHHCIGIAAKSKNRKRVSKICIYFILYFQALAQSSCVSASSKWDQCIKWRKMCTICVSSGATLIDKDFVKLPSGGFVTSVSDDSPPFLRKAVDKWLCVPFPLQVS